MSKEYMVLDNKDYCIARTVSLEEAHKVAISHPTAMLIREYADMTNKPRDGVVPTGKEWRLSTHDGVQEPVQSEAKS